MVSRQHGGRTPLDGHEKSATAWSAVELASSTYAASGEVLQQLAVTMRDEILGPLELHRRPPGSVVEIGSGLGRAFRRSQFHAWIEQTDPRSDVVEQRTGRGEPVRLMDLERLEGDRGSYQVVLANNVLDTLGRAGMASGLRAISDALSPGGILVHFMDLNAYHRPLCADLWARGHIPFPSLWGDRMPGLASVPRALLCQRIEATESVLGDEDRRMLESFLAGPLSAVEVLLNPVFQGKLLELFDQILRRVFRCLDIVAETRSFSDLFAEALGGEVSALPDLHVELRDFLVKTCDLPMSEPRGPGSINHIATSHGTLKRRRDPEVPAGLCRFSADLHVVKIRRA